MTDYATAGRGLKTLFIGEIICLFGLIPFVGLAGLIVMLVGLNTAAKAHEGYKTAFTIAILNIVVSLVAAFFAPLSIVTSILNVAMVCFVCNTSGELLQGKGDPAQAVRAQTVWKLYAVCLVVSIICSLLSYIPIINVAAALVSVVVAVASIVGGVLFLIFLYRASDSLQN